jgi:hypothetical protein
MLSRRFYGMEEVKVDKVPCVSMKLNKVTDVMSITSSFTVGENINKDVFSKRPITSGDEKKTMRPIVYIVPVLMTENAPQSLPALNPWPSGTNGICFSQHCIP